MDETDIRGDANVVAPDLALFEDEERKDAPERVVPGNAKQPMTRWPETVDSLNRPLFPRQLADTIAALNHQLATSPVLRAVETLNHQLATSPALRAVETLNHQLAASPALRAVEAMNRQVAVTTSLPPSLKPKDTPILRVIPQVSPDMYPHLNDLTDEDLALDRIPPGHRERIWLILYDYQITDPNLRRISMKLFADGHYAIAVERAYIYLNNLVKARTGLVDEGGSALMNRVFSVKNPILKLSNLCSPSERNEQLGYMQMLTGAMVGIRNPRAHEHEINDSPQEALEMLVLAHHLVRKVMGAIHS